MRHAPSLALVVVMCCGAVFQSTSGITDITGDGHCDTITAGVCSIVLDHVTGVDGQIADANLPGLDPGDGTPFNMTVTASGGGLTFVCTDCTASWWKVGPMIMAFQAKIEGTPTLAGASGELRFGGLPAVIFPVNDDQQIQASNVAGFTWPVGVLAPGAQAFAAGYFTLQSLKVNNSPVTWDVSNVVSGTPITLKINGTYRATQ